MRVKRLPKGDQEGHHPMTARERFDCSKVELKIVQEVPLFLTQSLAFARR